MRDLLLRAVDARVQPGGCQQGCVRPLFHDLAAKGSEKQRAAKHIASISAHIMDNGWVLRDLDGKPTRWGRWDPEYLLGPYGFESRGLTPTFAGRVLRAGDSYAVVTLVPPRGSR